MPLQEPAQTSQIPNVWSQERQGSSISVMAETTENDGAQECHRRLGLRTLALDIFQILIRSAKGREYENQ